MKPRCCYMKRTIDWILVLKVFVKWKQVNVVHCYVVKVFLGIKKSNIYQRCTIESISVNLINDENMIRHGLMCKETIHVWNKLEKFFETISERNNQGEFLLRRIEFRRCFIKSPILIYCIVCINEVLTVTRL